MPNLARAPQYKAVPNLERAAQLIGLELERKLVWFILYLTNFNNQTHYRKGNTYHGQKQLLWRSGVGIACNINIEKVATTSIWIVQMMIQRQYWKKLMAKYTENTFPRNLGLQVQFNLSEIVTVNRVWSTCSFVNHYTVVDIGPLGVGNSVNYFVPLTFTDYFTCLYNISGI